MPDRARPVVLTPELLRRYKDGEVVLQDAEQELILRCRIGGLSLGQYRLEVAPLWVAISEAPFPRVGPYWKIDPDWGNKPVVWTFGPNDRIHTLPPDDNLRLSVLSMDKLMLIYPPGGDAISSEFVHGLSAGHQIEQRARYQAWMATRGKRGHR